MAIEFTLRDDGIIDARCGSADELFSRALNDSIGSRAPHRARSQGLSTHWIDRVESQVRLAIAENDTSPFASGNVTYLRLGGEHVFAAYDFDPPGKHEQSMPIVEFLSVLDQWRDQVIAAGGASGPAASLTDEPSTRPTGPAT